MKTAAAELGVPVRTPERSSEVVDEVAASGVELGVVVAFGQLLPVALLDVVPHGFVNVHFSLLPRWRGAAPVERAMLAGDTETGVCIMALEAGLDTGPVYARATTSIAPDETAGELRARLVALGTALLLATVPDVATGTPDPQVGEPTYAEKLTVEEFKLDWSKPASELARMVRAGNPRPGAWTVDHGRRVKVWRARAHETRRRHGARARRCVGNGRHRRGRSSCWKCSRRASGRCPRPLGLRAGGMPPPDWDGDDGNAMTSARLVALDALVRIDDGAYAHIVLPAMLGSTRLADRDRAFVTDLVYGSVRARRRLDDLLEHVVKRPLQRLDAPVRAALRLGAYQLLHGVPPHAALSETVSALAARSPRARGFVNANLRALTRLGPPWPEPEDEAVALSYPDWLVVRFTSELGATDARDALAAMNEPAVVTLRPNPNRTSADELETELQRAGVHVERGSLP